VLQDPKLFHALLNCLNSSPVEAGLTDTGSHPVGRKRSYSFQASETEPNKHQKIQHSPMVKRGAPISVSDEGLNDISEVKIPVHVVAASILYAAFQHLDHWPAPILHAYAEDCFGSRSWVDDERCALLVQNLALVHTSDEDERMLDQKDLLNARLVASYYSREMKLSPGTTELSPLSSYTEPRFRRGSLTSSVSSSTGRPRSQSNASDGPPGSDSEDDDACLVEVSSGALERAGHGENDGSSSSSSSSGEEDEEVLGTAESFGKAANGTSERGTNSVTEQLDPQLTFPAPPTSIDLQRVRPRFVGENLDEAYSAIGTALSDRLDAKYKQNSRLVSTLSSFLSVPDVRRLIASSLERWLQSPALSGQARNLFTELVQSFKNVDPPLPSDAEAIESLLAMKLKSNQLNMHTENITAIATRLPSQEVARRILRRLLRAELSSLESAPSGSSSQSLQMVAAVHEVLPPPLFAEAFASGLLTLQEDASATSTNTTVTDEKRPHHEIGRIRHLIRSVASTLGTRFDCYSALESLASAVSPNTWTIQDEEDRARILFELALLFVPLSPGRENKQSVRSARRSQGGRKLLSEEETAHLTVQLLQARKVLLKWCCVIYAPLWLEEKGKLEPQRSRGTNRRGARDTNISDSLGAGPPNYSSILDKNDDKVVSQYCPDVIRCLLFTEGPESDAMLAFLRPTATMGQAFFVDDELRYRIEVCVRNGNNLDDELIRILLKHTFTTEDGSTSSTLYLSLIESLFYQCSRGQSNNLRIEDPELVWELYELAKYCPESCETVDSSGIPR
jgi:integrator complex subunit 1